MATKLTPTDFELLRQKNLADNKVMLAKLMEELKSIAPIGITPPPKRSRPSIGKPRRRDSDSAFVMRRNPARTARYTPYAPLSSPPNTRSRSRRGSVSSVVSSSSDGSLVSKEGSRLLVRFGAFGSPRCRHPDSDSDEDDERELVRKRRKSRAERQIRDAADVTEEDLDMVAVCVKEKKYDSEYGTSCHQCRQKTLDQKTICRSADCLGVRGQFCGPCLRNRYGEDAREVLKDQDWCCPPCRGVCNCSFCRKKNGQNATGILIHLAKENGYDNVNAYLQGLRKQLGQ